MKKKKKVLLIILLIVLVPLAFAVMSIASRGQKPAGLTPDGRLSPCPDSPNCVCSEYEGDQAAIEPLPFAGSAEAARAGLLEAIEYTGGTVREEDGNYICARYESAAFCFIDDLECRIDADNGVIHIRSASRVGHFDLGVNRSRVERLRAIRCVAELDRRRRP